MARSAPAAGVVERTVRAQPKIATAVGTAPRQIRMRRIRWRKARRIASEDKPRPAGGPSRYLRHRSAGAAPGESGVLTPSRPHALTGIQHRGEAAGDLPAGERGDCVMRLPLGNA